MSNVTQPAAEKTRGARNNIEVTVAQLAEFDEVIDVRSEGEFADDHIPGAVNFPVLNDAERAEVGTVYKQVSSFDAKKLGAAMVSVNIARHLRESFQGKPRGWRPLIYCWRGGGRSGALAHVLAQVGWRVGRLAGGYKAYRRAVLADLETLPAPLRFRVVCGMTGTGKSRLLAALRDAGAQVLDLEGLAAHRGSVLGNLPHEVQPPQKLFESRVWHALRGFDAAREVYVESESKKIGVLRVPDALINAMWAGEPLVLEAPAPVRVALLKEEYAHFLRDPVLLSTQLACLVPLHGRDVFDGWNALARAGRWDELTETLLVKHYDPSYTRAIRKHYPTLDQARVVTANSPDNATYQRLADEIMHGEQL
jgi:tRNA 2-selenouridine synthase